MTPAKLATTCRLLRTAHQFDEEYYKTGFGPNPYERSAPWLNFYAGIVDEIIRSLGPRRVLDAGCALGMMVEAFWDRGVEAEGVDISDYAIANVRGDMREYCRVASLTEPFTSRYDLIVCIEVLEHMPADAAATAVENIAASTDTVLFSSSPRDFEEVTHVNVRPPLSWMKLFGRHGLWPDLIYDASYVTPHAILFRRGTALPQDTLALMSEQLRLRFLQSEAKRLRQEADDQVVQAKAQVRQVQQEADVQVAQATEQLRQVRGELDKSRREGAAQAQDIATLRSALLETRQQTTRLTAIEASTIWRVTEPLRTVATRVPAAIRRRVRQVAKAAYWMMTPHKISARIAFIQRRSQIQAQSPVSLIGHSLGTASAPPLVPTIRSMIREHHIQWASLPVFSDRHAEPTLTIVTDSLDACQLFGGVGTSLVVGAIAAREMSARLRIVTRDSAPDAGALGEILHVHKVGFEGPVDFVHMPLRGDRPLPVGTRDVILTTSWWSTRAVLGSVDARQVLYLLQEDERMFYPNSDIRLLCSETISRLDLRTIVNTRLLFDHLADGADPLPGLRERGFWFDPAFPAIPRSKRSAVREGKKNFLFYARPNHPRNLYWRGLEVIDTVIRDGVLSPSEWNIHFVGADLPAMQLPGGERPTVWGNLPWAEYVELLSKIDLGLSLMDTPHPSYPPLDLAAAGAIVVTNTHGPKLSLANWSHNIICAPPSVAGLSDALRRGAAVAHDTAHRAANVATGHIHQDWNAQLRPVIDWLAERKLLTCF
jgi:SAM-dependent methyltransferase